MKLTKPGKDGASQLISSVRRTVSRRGDGKEGVGMTSEQPPLSRQPTRRGLDVRLAIGAMGFCLVGSAITLASRLYRIATRAELGQRPGSPFAAIGFRAALACLYALALVWLLRGERRGRILAALLLCLWAANAASISNRLPLDGQVFQRVVAIGLVGLALWVLRIFPRSTLLRDDAAPAVPRAAEQGDAADEAGASDGASQLIRSVKRTSPESTAWRRVKR